MDIQDLDIVDNNNQQNWPEGTMKVQDVNDAGRADEGLLARWFADWNGSKITGGTGSAYTLSSNTLPTAYYDGFLVVCEINVDCLADATLNVDVLGAATIKKNGTENLVAGDLKAGMVAIFVYRGTDWNLVSAAYLGTAAQKDTGTAIGDVVELEDVGGSAGLPAVDGSQLTGIATGGFVGDYQIFTTSGSFLKASLPAETENVTVWVIGAGGGGGGAPATAAGQSSGAGGGAGGGFSQERIAVSALATSETVTVGTGGAGGVGGSSGSSGGTSSFGTFCSATGGGGGSFSTATSTTISNNGSVGGSGSGGDLNCTGAPGDSGLNLTNAAKSGTGGASFLGGGGRSRAGAASIPGENGTTFGSGGGGASNGPNQTAATGGTGQDGIVIVFW